MTANTPILLASTSPHRRELLARLGVPFSCAAPEVDETPVPGEAPEARAGRLARAKASAVASSHPGAIVIGSDQVASLPGNDGSTLLRKPGNRETCRRQLAAMSGRLVCFDTAVAVMCGEHMLAHADHTEVHFRTLDAQAIEYYMDREPAFDCAGGFKCEGLGVTLFDSIRSRDPTALVGLPLIWLCGALRELGVAV